MGCVCCFVPVGIALVVFVGALLLRLAVVIVNRYLGKSKSETPIGWDWDSDEESLEPLPESKRIPEPGIIRGMAIVFLAAAAAGVVAVGTANELSRMMPRRDEEFQFVMYLAWLAVGWVTLTGFVALLLPTTIKRAIAIALVTQFLYAALTIPLLVPLFLRIR
jgi:hypothetical protein